MPRDGGDLRLAAPRERQARYGGAAEIVEGDPDNPGFAAGFRP